MLKLDRSLIARRAGVLGVAAALALPGAALAQDDPVAHAAQAPQLEVKISAPKAMTRAQLKKKGVVGTVTCNQACNASLTLTSPNGIVGTRSVTFSAAGTKKAPKITLGIYLDPLKKGAKLALTVNALVNAGTPDEQRDVAQAKIKVLD
jgi:hypothetical protein